jgi:hypothetical protein
MSHGDIADVLRQQIAATDDAGFPILRVQHATPAILERLVSEAERRSVTLAVEINSPHTIKGRSVQEMLALFERTKSPRLGFLADLGTTARRLSTWLMDTYRRKGVPEDAIEMVRDAWGRTSSEDQMLMREEIIDTLSARGCDDVTVRFVNQAFVLFGRDDPEHWKEVLPHVVHTHVKLFEVDENGADPCIPYDVLIPLFKEGGYTRVFSWEYEGWLWSASPPSVPWPGPSASDAIAAHQRYVRNLWATTSISHSESRPGDVAPGEV